jgi:hypothetical protein
MPAKKDADEIASNEYFAGLFKARQRRLKRPTFSLSM